MFHLTKNPTMDDDELTYPGMSEREAAIRRRVHRLAEFYRHLFVYVLVNLLLWAINGWQLWNSPAASKWWAYWALWPTLGWGIGVLGHGLSVLPGGMFTQDWEERKVREIMARENKQ
ncbi:MAG: 2TM domain-containing protein [Burkholderiales bacterium]|nr:2TM domain-containing protein [Burkholderiales bacterium]